MKTYGERRGEAEEYKRRRGEEEIGEGGIKRRGGGEMVKKVRKRDRKERK